MDNSGTKGTLPRTSVKFAATILFLGLLCRGAATSGCVISEDPLQYVTYDPETHICCGGRVYAQSWTGNGPIGCCGDGMTGQIFHHWTSFCCGRTLVSWDDTDLKCCDERLVYSETSQMCCGSNVVAKSNRSYECCGNSGPFNPGSELCCQAAGQSIIRRVSDMTEGHKTCCGLNVMDSTTHMCCNGVKHPKTPFLACCRGDTYNVNSHVCCDSGVFPIGREGRTQCCRDGAYNPDNEVCCGGQIYPAGQSKCCGQTVHYKPNAQQCCSGQLANLPKIKGVAGCCRDQAFLQSSKMCCDATLHDRHDDMECCGSVTYNKISQLCCRGVVVNKGSDEDTCCAAASYNPSTHTCCRDNIYEGVGQCCYLTSTTEAIVGPEQKCCQVYDWAHASNVFGRLHSVSEDQDRCCGLELMGKNQLCSNGRLLDKLAAGDDSVCCYEIGTGENICQTFNSAEAFCHPSRGIHLLGHLLQCGLSLYDPTSHLCCSLLVRPRPGPDPARTACCGFQTYNMDQQTCHLDLVFDIPVANAGFCRDVVFDNQTHMCYNNYLIRPIEEVQEFPDVCGTTPYHPTQHQCCGEVLISANFTCCDNKEWNTPGTALGEGSCCMGPEGISQGFNAQTQVCCDGEVHDTNGQDLACCGTEAFPFSDNSICCDGVLHNPTTPSNHECCGRSLIDTTSQLCCADIVHVMEDGMTQCCGKRPYDSSSQLCCGPSLYAMDYPNQACCGSLTFDSSTQLCRSMGDESYVFEQATSGDLLCDAGSYNYDPTRHTCHQGLLFRNVVGGVGCGNRVVHDPEREVCCGGEVKEKWGDYTECCGTHLINPQVKMCCGNRSMWRNSYAYRCLNGQIVPNTFHDPM